MRDTTPLHNFDFRALDQPHFKEDSVREEIVAPIIRALGYAPIGNAQVRRSVRLDHPFVTIGSVTRRLSLVPDYLLCIGERPVCVIDAKAPSEDVLDNNHLSQAYSYAIHRDIRAELYGLCNGRKLALFRVSEMTNEPFLLVNLPDIRDRWQDIEAALSPLQLFSKDRSNFSKDFGLHLQRLGFDSTTEIVFPGMPLFSVGRMFDELYGIGANVATEGVTYAAQFDIDASLIPDLLRRLPPRLSAVLRAKLERHPCVVHVGYDIEPARLNIAAHLGPDLLENEDEIYRPLLVSRFVE